MLDLRPVYVLLYVVLWSTQSLLIKQSVRSDASDPADSHYPYEVLSMIILVETFKLIAALSIYFLLDDDDDGLAAKPLSKSAKLAANFADGLLLIIPACLYAAYNGLSFLCLKLMEPGSVRVLINVRVVFTGAILHLAFGRRLSPRQWSALVLLFAACVVEQSGSVRLGVGGGVMALALVLLQGLCSSLGGVYFQWLLQRNKAASLGVWPTNIYLYSWSLGVYAVAVCAWRPDLLGPGAFLRNVDGRAVLIVIVAGLGGLLTAMLLRHLNVIVKEYANFAEMVVVGVAQHVLFGTPLRPTLFVAIALVTTSLVLYHSPAEPWRRAGTAPSSYKMDGRSYLACYRLERTR